MEFETTSDPAEAAGSSPSELDVAARFVDDQQDVEAGAAEAATPGEDVAQPAAPAWTPSRDELQELIGDTVAQQLGYLYQQQQQPVAESEQQVDYDELDLYDPNNLAAFIQHSNQQAIEQALAPLMPVIQRSQAEQAEAQVDGWLTESKEKVGGFTDAESDTMSAYVAHGMLPGTIDPYRSPSGNPQRAIEKAAEYVKEYEERLMKKGEERLLARQRGLQEVAQRDATPAQSSGVPATEILVRDSGEDEIAAAARIVARINGGMA